MSSKTIINHYTRLLTRWPRDLLRPDQPSFHSLLQSRIASLQPSASPSPSISSTSKSTPTPMTEAAAKREINAAYLLLEDHFARREPLSDAMMNPRSQPSLYKDLARELEEAPKTTWWGGVKKRLGGLVRMS